MRGNKHIYKLVKPQVLEAVALPQIYADPIQHKGYSNIT